MSLYGPAIFILIFIATSLNLRIERQKKRNVFFFFQEFYYCPFDFSGKKKRKEIIYQEFYYHPFDLNK